MVMKTEGSLGPYRYTMEDHPDYGERCVWRTRLRRGLQS